MKGIKSDWSKEETDHLLRLCERFALKFIIIADRFDWVTDTEDVGGGE